MKRVIAETITSLVLIALVLGILTAFIRGVNTVRGYLIHVLICGLILVPSGLYMEYKGIDPLLKYAVIILIAPFTTYIFNGLHIVGKRFEEDPKKFFDDWRKRK